MKIILRKQYVNYEPSEYEFLGTVSIQRIKEDFKNFPWEEQIEHKDQLLGLHVSPSFNLEYKNKELTITGYQNGQFSVRYNHRAILLWQFEANMFSMEEVFDLINQFTILKPKQFKKILATKSTIEESFLSIIAITLTNKKKKPFSAYVSQARNQFKITFKRLFYYFVFSLIWLLVPLGLEIFNGGKTGLTTFLVFQGIFLLLALPAIILSINHLKHNGKLKLIFKKGENKFEVINHSRSIFFDKKDVVKIIEIDTGTSRAPWGEYGYSIVQFKDGSELWLSTILIGTIDLNEQFYIVKKEYKEVWMPFLKKTMFLNK